MGSDNLVFKVLRMKRKVKLAIMIASIGSVAAFGGKFFEIYPESAVKKVANFSKPSLLIGTGLS